MLIVQRGRRRDHKQNQIALLQLLASHLFVRGGRIDAWGVVKIKTSP
jgi:hypothetical protein